MIVAVDFDGTIVTHKYPDIGQPVPFAIETMKDLIARGDRLVLWTMRDGEELDQAVKYCSKNGVEFWGINSNPEQHTWTESSKAYAQIYIDDAALGCPLKSGVLNGRRESRPWVDWLSVRSHLGLDKH
jgi:hypothetical protein